jgi:hypothetical protein
VVNPQPSLPGYQGGQCPDLYRYEGGEHTIILFDPATGAELDRYTAYFDANVFGSDIPGPILKIFPNVGEIFGGHLQGNVSVYNTDPSSYYPGRTYQFESKPT